jgi:hypothetical protein
MKSNVLSMKERPAEEKCLQTDNFFIIVIYFIYTILHNMVYCAYIIM